jgi:glycosyltransferase involved in cell wall biosynthesis
MRILVVQESDWLEKGPHQSHHLMERLSILGHEVRVIDYEILWRGHAGHEVVSKRSVHYGVHKATENGNITLVRPAIVRLPILSYLSLAYTHRKEIQRQINEFKPDVIIGFGLLNAFIALRLAKKARIPFVYYIIDELHRLVPEAVLRPLAKLIERSNMKASTIVVSINEALREYTIQMGAHPEKTSVVRAGIDFGLYNQGTDSRGFRKELGIQEGEVVLFFMGWLYGFSGLKEVALHLAREPVRYSKIKLLIIGKGELWDTIERIRKNNHLENKIVLLDWKPYNEVPGYIAASDICILPAYNNQVMKNIVPIKMYEYMTSQKPVIATRLPGLVKEFGANNGVSYVDEPREVVEKAAELVRNGLIESEGRKSRAFVQGMDWETTTNSFERILRVIAGIGTAQRKD